MKDKALKCPNCGGNVNRERMVCEYCGTQFKRDPDPNVIHVCSWNPKMEVIGGKVILDDLAFGTAGLVETSKIAIEMLAKKLAEGLIPYMEIQQTHDPRRMQMEYNARVRVLRPDHRF